MNKNSKHLKNILYVQYFIVVQITQQGVTP